MKIAAQLYTVRQFMDTPENMAATLKKIKEIGYNAVQVSKIGPIGDPEFKELVDREKLSICATHIDYRELLNNLEAVIKRHQIWDCKYVGVSIMPDEYRHTREGYVKFAKEASEIGRKLKEAGMQFIYHNHDFEFTKFDGKSGMDIILEESDPEAFGYEIDLFWVQAGGEDPIKWIHKVNGMMPVVHLKDFIVTSSRERRFAEIGEGNLNFPGILEACKETNIEWGIVEQDQSYDRDPFDSLAISLNYLRKLGANI